MDTSKKQSTEILKAVSVGARKMFQCQKCKKGTMKMSNSGFSGTVTKCDNCGYKETLVSTR